MALAGCRRGWRQLSPVGACPRSDALMWVVLSGSPIEVLLPASFAVAFCVGTAKPKRGKFAELRRKECWSCEKCRCGLGRL
jgi:hypothetical protein